MVGAVTPEQVQQSVDALFGHLAGSARPPALEEPSMPDSGPHKVTVRGPLPTDQVTLMLGMRTAGCLHPDRWALSVLAQVLDTSLTKEIRYRQGLVDGLGVYNDLYQDTGYLAIQTTSSGRNRSTIQRTAEEYVQQIGEGQVDAEEVARAQAAIQGSWALSMEDNQSRASWLAGWATVLSDDEPVPDVPALIGAVAPEDLTRVVTTYYTPERRFVGLHLPYFDSAAGTLAKPWTYIAKPTLPKLAPVHNFQRRLVNPDSIAIAVIPLALSTPCRLRVQHQDLVRPGPG